MRRQDRRPRTGAQKPHSQADPWFKNEAWFHGPHWRDVPGDVRLKLYFRLIKAYYAPRLTALYANPFVGGMPWRETDDDTFARKYVVPVVLGAK